jgi:hypothetical protein
MNGNGVILYLVKSLLNCSTKGANCNKSLFRSVPHKVFFSVSVDVELDAAAGTFQHGLVTAVFEDDEVRFYFFHFFHNGARGTRTLLTKGHIGFTSVYS